MKKRVRKRNTVNDASRRRKQSPFTSNIWFHLATIMISINYSNETLRNGEENLTSFEERTVTSETPFEIAC